MHAYLSLTNLHTPGDTQSSPFSHGEMHRASLSYEINVLIITLNNTNSKETVECEYTT